MADFHVTLAILTRNRPECLVRALEAARDAAHPPNEILVSDDSDDAIRPQNQTLASGHELVRYIQGPRRGLGANENHLVANLLPQTDWIVFNGDDARLSETFMVELRRLIVVHGPHRRIPCGVEIRDGVLVRPKRLSFLGFQSRDYDDYSPGAEVETVVVQATAFPHDALRQVSWLEVSSYGYDEVDMAHKLRLLGWRFVFEPSICLYHDQAFEGRDAYPRPTQIARLYFRMRSHSVYDRHPWGLIAFMFLAPVHLAAATARRRRWRQLSEVPAITATAYGAWWRSLRRDWRRT